MNSKDEEQMEKFEHALKFGRSLFTLPMLGSGYLVRSKTLKDGDQVQGEVKHMTEEEVGITPAFLTILRKLKI